MSNYPDNVKCYWLEATNRYKRLLTRFSHDNRCINNAMCKASTFIEVVESDEQMVSGAIPWPSDDPRWPLECERCKKPFGVRDLSYVYHHKLFISSDTGTEISLKEATIGAMWDGSGMFDADESEYLGPDGKYLTVICPDGVKWTIDGHANNCNMEGTKHKCWTRTGIPPRITVTGTPGHSGAGSILNNSTGYHAFLRDGVFTKC